MAMVIKEFQPVGPAEVPVKRDYLTKECLRISAIENIPFKAPLKLPFISTDLLRSACALSEMKNEQWALTDLIFKSVWCDSMDPEDLSAILEKSDFSEEVKTQCHDKYSRKTLKINSKKAIEEKLFGVPSFSLYRDDELVDVFWGVNSIEHLKLFLKGDLNIDQSTLGDFNNLFS